MKLEELELENYCMQTSDQIDVMIRGTDRRVCSFTLGYGSPVDQENEAYAKSFVKNHNAILGASNA